MPLLNRIVLLLALCCSAMFSHAAHAQNYSDIWWNPSESGWGLTLADHDTQLFGVWYTYAPNGSPTWYVIPGGTFTQGKRFFSADIYQTTGPAYNTPFNTNLVSATKVGTANFDFSPPALASGNALFTYSIGTQTGTKQIQRQPFGNAIPNWGTDFTEIWWNANESGWGLTLAQHGNNIFGVWYTYDTLGNPLWVVLPGVTFNGNNSFSGPLYTTTGPYFAMVPFNPANVVVTPVGSASLTFNGRSGTFTSTVNGFTQTKSITSQPFGNSAPGSAAPKANLTPYQRTGWSDKIVVARARDVNIDSTDLLTTDTLYVGWAVVNNGVAATAVRNFTQIYLDGVAINSWYDDPPTDPDFYFSVRNYSIGSLPPGNHTLRIVADATAAIDESDETDNAYTKTFSVRSPTPAALGSMAWTIGNQCSTGAEIDYKFYDFSNNLVWPSSTSHYYINYGQTQTARLSCTAGAKICLGANSGSLYWGVGLAGNSSCTNCCYFCDGGTHAYNFGGCGGTTTPPPPTTPPPASCTTNIGTLNISSDIYALIYINGQLRGVGQAIMQLPAGSYFLSVRDTNNRQCYSQTVYVNACRVNEYRSNTYCRAF